MNGKAAACVSGVLNVEQKAFVLAPFPTALVTPSSSFMSTGSKPKVSGKRKASLITDSDSSSTLQSINYQETSSLLLGQVDEDKLTKQVKTVQHGGSFDNSFSVFLTVMLFDCILVQHDPQAQVYISQGQGDADVFMSIPSLDARITLWKETGKTLVETEKEDARALLTSFILAQLVVITQG